MLTALLLAVGCTGSPQEKPDQLETPTPKAVQSETPRSKVDRVLLNGRLLTAPLYTVSGEPYKLPLVWPKEDILGPGKSFPGKEISSLISGSKATQPVVITSQPSKGSKVEERALAHTLQSIRERRPLNILLGDQYALFGQDYSSVMANIPRMDIGSLSWLRNPIAYIEQQGKEITVVLVRYSPIPADKRPDLKPRSYGHNYNGITWVEPIVSKITPFAPDYSDHVWEARKFMGTCDSSPSTLCLYKHIQKDAPQGRQQLILVAQPNFLEYEHVDGYNKRLAQGFFTASVAGGDQIQIGRVWYAGSPGQFATQRIQELLENGGSSLSAADIANLPAITFTG